MIFGDDNPTTDVIYATESIQRVNQHKFLGIVIDQKLKFEEHIKFISKNSYKGLNVLRCLAGISWGADPKILSILYKAIVRSHFDYSTLAYINCTYVHRLDIIQNKALRIISGAMCSTPIRAMEVETKIMPLILRRILLCERYCVKLLSSSNKDVINRIVPHLVNVSGPLSSADELLSGITPQLCRIYLEIYNKCKRIKKQSQWPCYAHNYVSITYPIHVLEHRVTSNNDMLEFLSENNKYYTLYTDGSKGDDHVRSALYDPQTRFTQSFVLDNACSIFTAEAYAILEALKLISHIHQSYKFFLILTDSLSVLEALKNLKFSFKTNYILYIIKDLVYKLNCKDTEISFMWIPSHKGISGNEVADRTANKGINSLDVQYVASVPHTDYYSFINEELKNLWVEMWKKDQEQKGKWYGSIQTDLPTEPWYNDLESASRHFITTINRLRFGHTTTPAHLSRLGIISSDSCKFCNTPQADAEHLILNCQNFAIERLILASELSDILPNNSSRRLNDILKTKKCFVPIFKFIKNSCGSV